MTKTHTLTHTTDEKQINLKPVYSRPKTPKQLNFKEVSGRLDYITFKNKVSTMGKSFCK